MDPNRVERRGDFRMTHWDAHAIRALMFVPGSDEHKLAKVWSYGSDMTVVDLEDAVAVGQKLVARDRASAAISAYGRESVAAARVNPVESDWFEGDVSAVVLSGLDVIVLPKVETVQTLRHADAVIAAAERAAGLTVGAIRLLVSIETPIGVARCEELLAKAPDRTFTAVFGSGDFSTALGVDLTVDATEILYARSRIVIATRAAGFPAPIDGAWFSLDDDQGLEADSARSRQLGFQGRVALHPKQLDTILRSYASLDEDEEALNRRIVEAFETAEKDGVASIRVDGRFVDYPIYRLARERISRYESWRTAALDNGAV
ncbi:HpcH/HpaI aldolase/citrate lyase family protein [Amycolatopsis pithecellobii]|uniref:CoA ester lyase n=1 Tax=Amycolatopsis pithecellobii TaxID=664692 RepID=A0A6N7Z4X6_9PSEU|nr:CoA ester lyase [Amycolatopsis pithecellobii]MTD54366.1 CoA ester lyase [Amycolatopsis pithecellobii]